jgi:hypothetical protein
MIELILIQSYDKYTLHHVSSIIVWPRSSNVRDWLIYHELLIKLDAVS